MIEARSLVGAEWRGAGAGEPLRSPFDGAEVGQLFGACLADVDHAVEAAAAALPAWRDTPAHVRSAVLARLAALMGERAEDLAWAMVRPTGKTIRDARAEVVRSIATMEVSAEEAKRIGGEVIALDAVPSGAGKLGLTVRQPVGVVAGISPFNAPLNLVCHKLGPALAGGNALVLKPHPLGSAVASLLGELALQAGLPAGVFNIVQGGAEIGARLIAHPTVALVNFTGSGAVADRIVRDAGLKRTVLELGGNAPTIVHADADLGRAVSLCLDAAFGLSGQSCVSTQRLYVHQDVFDEFVGRFVAAAAARRVGDPADPTTDVGPMISAEAAERVEAWVNEAVAAGADLRCGGRREGALFWPTVLADVRPEMRIQCDEVFGPVATAAQYGAVEDAIRWANDTPWGLKAGIFTRSLEVALLAMRRLEYGTVNVNGPSRSRTDHEPSGGVKQSGWGKEGPRWAIEEMTDLKMISVAPW